MVEVLGVYAARPPTPPKGSHGLIRHDAGQMSAQANMFTTSGESPSSTAESTILRSSKKVNFSPITSYIKSSPFTSRTSTSTTELRPIPPSNESKPGKSILKITPLNMHPLEESQPESVAALLESTTRQLAGESLSSRVDAYMQLLGALKVYDNISDQDDMESKAGLLLQFVQRDISIDLGKGDFVETNLVTNALKLGIYIIWSPQLAAQIPDEFKIFIIDHALSVLVEGKLSKAILNHYVHILYTQNFSAKIMTNSRITRILSVLNDITDRVNGNGIISQRLGVYTRLLSQSKSAMASQAPLWIEHLISGLLHPTRDTRSKAIVLGSQTALLLGPNLVISRTILDLFDKEISPDRKLISEVCDRMGRMMSPSESGVHVPQIWSIIVLLLRSKRFNIEKWQYFKQWVLVLQKCFNCSDPAVKTQALIGWNKFVYMITCNEHTSRSMLRMLTRPILSSSERRRSEKSGASANVVFISSYYNLLYYSFRPGIAFDHIDFIWDEYISQPFTNVFAPNAQLNDAACKALSSLIWTSQSRIWTENKVHEVTRMETDFILPIDCKWIRSRVTSVIAAFETLLGFAAWVNKQRLWTDICMALSEASSKEIKPSNELTQAIAAMLGLLTRLRLSSPASLNAETDATFIERLTILATVLISCVGPSPFTETLLLKTSQDTFQTTTTPAHKRPRSDPNLETPFLHILRTIGCHEDEHNLASPSFQTQLDGLFEAGLKGRQTRGPRLELLERCTALEMETPEKRNVKFKLQSFIWDAAARATVKCLSSLPMESLRERDGTISRDYTNVLHILERGVGFTNLHASWNALLEAFTRIVRIERGGHDIFNLVLEPISQKLIQTNHVQAYLPTKALMNQALTLTNFQQNRRTADHNVSDSTSSFFPEDLLNLIRKMLSYAYTLFQASDSVTLAEFFESLTSLLGSGPAEFRCLLLDRLQESLALWLRDSSRLINTENKTDSRLLTACRMLSSAIANILQTAVPHDTASLHTYEVIISAGLDSVHKSSVNRFIEMWNATFGLQEITHCPSDVLSALQKLEHLVELRLPGSFPRAKPQDITIPDAVDSRDIGSSEQHMNQYGRMLRNLNGQNARPVPFSSSPIVQSTEDVDAHNALQQKGNSTPRRRLRHNKSKVQFLTANQGSQSPVIESPLLNERQMDSTGKKRGKKAKFLEDLGSSSPVDTLTSENRVFSPRSFPVASNLAQEPEGPSTPVLDAHLTDNDDEFPGSSPTPAARDPGYLTKQGTTALTLATVDMLHSDPPSSPPELPVQSPKGKEIARNSNSLPSSPQRISTVEVSANHHDHETSSSKNIDSVLPVKKILEANPDATDSDALESNKLQTDNDTKSSAAAQEILDTIPDTYADEFEQQLASQLEQDLELAVDLEDQDDVASMQSSDVNLPRGPITRKRKRNAEVEEPSSLKRNKRRSSKDHEAAQLESSQGHSSGSESVTMKRSTPKSSRSRRRISTPQSSPLKNQISADDLSRTTTPESRRRSGRLNSAPERETASSPIKSRGSRSRKRRSLRLSGAPAFSPPRADVKTKAQRKKQPKSGTITEDIPTVTPDQDTNMSDSQNAVANDQADGDVRSDENTLASPEVNSQLEDTHVPSALDLQNTTNLEMQSEEHAVEQDVAMEEAIPENDTTDLAPPTESEETPRYISQGVQTDDFHNIPANGFEAGQSGGSILGSLRRVLNGIRNVTFGRSLLREIDDVMFDIRVEAHEAARRNQD